MRYAFLTFFVFLINSMALAGSITLQTGIRWDLKDNIQIQVEVVNKGDESAYYVQAEIRMGIHVENTEVVNTISPGNMTRFSVSIPLDDQKKDGSFPMICRLLYKDSNGYGFSAVSWNVISTGKSRIPKIAGKIPEIYLDRSNTLDILIKNNHNAPVKLKAELVLPNEISCATASRMVDIVAGGEERFGFELKNFSAMTGSTYAAPVIIEYDDEGYHYSIVIPGIIKIVETRWTSVFADKRFIIGVIAGLIFIIIWYQIRSPSSVSRK